MASTKHFTEGPEKIDAHIWIENGEYFLCLFNGWESTFIRISKRSGLECIKFGMAVDGDTDK